jgi:hypothetical protein
VINTNANAYDDWATYWQGLYPGFTNTAPEADPDGDSFDNNKEFAFDGNPAVGTPALLQVVPSGSDAVFRWIARNSGVSYQVQGSTNLLAAWTNNDSVTISNSLDQSGISLPGEYTRKEFVLPAIGNGFQRIQATVAP